MELLGLQDPLNSIIDQEISDGSDSLSNSSLMLTTIR